ncbi:XRE family transcriptional regulator [Streptomyces dioscori]|uniref:XRE family transcriptional regulator n=1 Tax=Streptomyces dioscori TaxID=2109333 RepID=A0A2P8PY60_9ACTN|nr:XRE family transcriptional regulator [Streptomyces dioscori]PSM38932.1 XRE family transcriptional regulator [Streptomyces dioscori]
MTERKSIGEQVEATAAAAEADNFARDVGAAVRHRRQELGMASKKLAAQLGVSASFITQLEQGQSSISLPRLYRLAELLGTTPNGLLPVSSTSILITRAGTGQEMQAANRKDAQRPRLLTRGGSGLSLKAHRYLIEQADPPQDWFEHEGEDFVYVIRGHLRVEFLRGRPVDLGPGDALNHDGDVPHRWGLGSDEPAEVLIVNNFQH